MVRHILLARTLRDGLRALPIIGRTQSEVVIVTPRTKVAGRGLSVESVLVLADLHGDELSELLEEVAPCLAVSGGTFEWLNIYAEDIG